MHVLRRNHAPCIPFAEAWTLPKVLVSPAGIPWIYDLSPDMSKTPTKSTGIGRMDIIWTYGHKMDINCHPASCREPSPRFAAEGRAKPVLTCSAHVAVASPLVRSL